MSNTEQQTIKKGPGRPALGEKTILKNFRIRRSLVQRMEEDKINKTELVNRLLQEYYHNIDKIKENEQ